MNNYRVATTFCLIPNVLGLGGLKVLVRIEERYVLLYSIP
jgi:hypothetical protein